MRHALLTTVLLASACGHFQMACPAAGGPTWIEATSTHFTMRTDLPADEAEKLLREDEEVLAKFTAVADFFLPPAVAMGRTSLVVFAEQWQYQKLVSQQQIGAPWVELGRFVGYDERGRATLALSVEKNAPELFRHELAHRLLRQRIGDPPQWLDEGFAEYFSVLPVADGKIALGGPTRRLLEFNIGFRRSAVVQAQQHYAEPTVVIKDMLENDKKYAYSNGGYLMAWLLVHYLANGGPDHADHFRRFVRAVADGQPWQKALLAEYGPLPLIELACRKHLVQMGNDEALQWLIPYTAPQGSSWSIAVRTLDDAEVHGLKATLRPSTDAEELKLATLHAPQSAALHRWLAVRAAMRRDFATAEREITTATTLSSDPFYRVEKMGVALLRELAKPEAERHLESLRDEMRATVRWAAEPTQLAAYARYYELVHDYAFGTTLAARAVAMDPHCSSCLVTLASLYFADGKADDAATTLQSAVNRWPDKTVPADVTARLHQYRCASASPAADCARR